jgi:hypothetical protein
LSGGLAFVPVSFADIFFSFRKLFQRSSVKKTLICTKKLADAALGLPTLHLGQKSFLTVDMAKLPC